MGILGNGHQSGGIRDEPDTLCGLQSHERRNRMYDMSRRPLLSGDKVRVKDSSFNCARPIDQRYGDAKASAARPIEVQGRASGYDVSWWWSGGWVVGRSEAVIHVKHR
ncbi:hypothetical protein BS47DRAFT_1351305 [Hydnum rufescens UP504]|uniref:Uncharacterized protein n=1 Tax=Hydnum rufescens UP504 TaxID=1448309 RepID=A0A9P6DM82_9AGAM|nr:hypothetical protein BS47DRAFT_1351305 [Hydnum rufescens UP504]